LIKNFILINSKLGIIFTHQLIVLPIFFELVGGRELAAGYLQCDLHAAVPHIFPLTRRFAVDVLVEVDEPEAATMY